MATSFPSAHIEMVTIDLRELIQQIQHNAEAQQHTDTHLLPILYGEPRELLSICVSALKLPNKDIVRLETSSHVFTIHKRMKRRIQSVKRMRKDVRGLFKGITKVMKIMEDGGNLSDRNKASFENLERLARDVDEEVARVKRILKWIDFESMRRSSLREVERTSGGNDTERGYKEVSNYDLCRLVQGVFCLLIALMLICRFF